MEKFPVGSADWASQQIAAYASLHERYERYAATLCALLRRVVERVAPAAQVVGRAKTVASFGEKIQRKRAKYDEPVDELTDLCGARVIVFGASEKAAVCRTLRECGLFAVDERNSEDEHGRLGVGVFGYRSAHFVVQLDPARLEHGLDGVRVDEDLFPRRVVQPRASPMKAEIQVRTSLEDAWATFTHDRAYKGDARPPEPWRRALNAISAALESADNEFARLERDLPHFESSYGQCLSTAEVEERRTQLRVVANALCADDKDRAAIALKLGRLAAARLDWRQVESELRDHARAPGTVGRDVALELGRALCELGRDPAAAAELRRGRELLCSVADVPMNALDAEDVSFLPATLGGDRARACAAHVLARTIEGPGGESAVARKLHGLAHAADPTNPYLFAGYLEHELSYARGDELIEWSRPTIDAALAACRLHAEVGIELPWTHFTRGFLLLVSGNTFGALAAYAKGIGTCALDSQLSSALRTLDRLRRAERRFDALPSARRLLHAGVLAKFPDSAAAREVKRVENGESSAARERRTSAKTPKASAGAALFALPVTIVAGGASATVEDEMRAHQDSLTEALRGLRGTLIAGGTTAGIPGLVGAIKATLSKTGEGAFRLIGYLPELVPNETQRDTRYDELRTAPGEGFGPEQVLQYWIDLLLAGVRPSGVRLLGINGGPISMLEYQLALGLGAKVAVVATSGRAVASLQDDPDWGEDPGLTAIANAAELTGFLLANEDGEVLRVGGDDLVERIARAIHEDYVGERRHNTDAAMQPWEKLREDFKRSNRGQALGMGAILWRGGFDLRPASGAAEAVRQFTADEIERMADLEHTRWCSERMASGWRYGKERDDQRKLSPYLVPYRDLDDHVKKWDRDAVTKYPDRAKLAGLEIVRRTRAPS